MTTGQAVQKEPQPFETNRVRYCPDRPFPPYRFISGVTPHPVIDVQGHSYGKKEERLSFMAPEDWAKNEPYLYAVDLYNFNYWWEAHEEWEKIWKMTERTDRYGQFLQGLIQISAGMIKWWIGNEKGMEKLLRDGTRRLASVGQSEFMGLEIGRQIEKVTLFLESKKQRNYPFIDLLVYWQ